MLKEILVGQARRAIPEYRQFEAEARKGGARVIEAEHVLLALAASDAGVGRLLLAAGLDHKRLAAALHEERRRSLAVAGMEHLAESAIAASEPDRAISLGTSAKEALRRALHTNRSRHARLNGVDLMIGILQAELGTVPRALTLAGVDRAALIARARESAGVTARPC
jgi:Clp amino terminal domain, pathogenicity island component